MRTAISNPSLKLKHIFLKGCSEIIVLMCLLALQMVKTGSMQIREYDIDHLALLEG